MKPSTYNFEDMIMWCLADYFTPQGLATDAMEQGHSLEATLSSAL